MGGCQRCMQQVDPESAYTKCTDHTTLWAAYYGHLTCMKDAHESGAAWHHLTCSTAANGGHLECLEYAHENGAVWNALTIARAAGNGHMECLKYAHEHGALLMPGCDIMALAMRWVDRPSRCWPECRAYLQALQLLHATDVSAHQRAVIIESIVERDLITRLDGLGLGGDHV